MLKEKEHFEPLGDGIEIIVSRDFHFTTDTILLAHFANHRKRDKAVDLCTGCGTIPLLWCRDNKNLEIAAVEIQENGADMAERSVKLNHLEEKITGAILSEEEMSDNASPELASIRRKIKAKENSVRDQLEKLIRSGSLKTVLQDAIITQRNGRYVVPVKNEHRGAVSGLVHDTSSTGATVFIEPTGVVEANNDIRVLKGKEAQEIERILYELSVEAGGFAEEIKGSYESAVEINVIFAKAHLGYQMKGSVPILNDDGETLLNKARHPLIDPKKVVATDIRLGKEFDTLVITGPNTGGKTVAIKTIGLLSAMASTGMLIPAFDESKVSVYDHILVDIGDEQSIEQSLSTFSSHMVNIVNILAVADEKSLVLIDELGAGTDPVEGAALAMAILEQLHRQGAKIAATTHYAELKAYALQTPRVENGSCEFDVNSLKPTYRLLIGIPGRSNAFAISEKLGIDKGIIERAGELVSSENVRFEDVVDMLEKSRLEMEDERSKAVEITESAKKDREKAEKLLSDAQFRRDREIENARGEAMRIVEHARREANALLNEVEKLKKEAEQYGVSVENLEIHKVFLRLRCLICKKISRPPTANPFSSAALWPLKSARRYLVWKRKQKQWSTGIIGSGP